MMLTIHNSKPEEGTSVAWLRHATAGQITAEISNWVCELRDGRVTELHIIINRDGIGETASNTPQNKV